VSFFASQCYALSNEEADLLKLERSTIDPISIRGAAEKVLQKFPDSVAAHVVLSKLEEARGRMDMALVEAKRARVAGKSLPVDNADDQPSLPIIALYRLAEVYGHLNRPSEQLEVLEEYERLNGHLYEVRSGIEFSAARLKFTALMKLGCFATATQYLDAIEAHPRKLGLLTKQDQIAMDRVTLAGLAQRDSEKAFLLSIELDATLQKNGRPLDAGYSVNFAKWSARQLDLTRARVYLKEATATLNPETRFNPFQKLAEIEMACGNWDAAQKQIGNAWNLLQVKTPAVRQEMQRSLRLTVSRFYLLYGYPDKALLHLENSYAEPPRMRDSLDSSTRWKAEASFASAEAFQGNLALFGTLRTPSHSKPLAWIDARLSVWLAKQKCANLIGATFAEPAAPQSCVSIFASFWPAWWLGLPTVYGSQSCSRLIETLGLDQSLVSYLPALKAVALGPGKNGRLLAAEALQAVPAWDAVTRARMERIIAESAKSSPEARAHFLACYQLHPPSLIGARVPVKFEGGPEFSNLKNALFSSQSLKSAESEYVLILDVQESQVSLKTPEGKSLRNAQLEMGESAEVDAVNVLRLMFAAEAPLSDRQISSLDGGALVKGAALEKLFERK